MTKIYFGENLELSSNLDGVGGPLLVVCQIKSLPLDFCASVNRFVHVDDSSWFQTTFNWFLDV